MYENFDKYVLENNSEQIKNDIAYFVIDLKYNKNAMIDSKLNNAIQNINDLPSKEFKFI